MNTKELDKILAKADLTLTIVSTRYGSGYTAFISEDSITSTIAESVTGGNYEYEKTKALADSGYPITYGKTIEQVINELNALIGNTILSYGIDVTTSFIYHTNDLIYCDYRKENIITIQEYIANF